MKIYGQESDIDTDLSSLIKEVSDLFNKPSDPIKDDGSDDQTSGNAQFIARAREWVAVNMPYCGGINGGNDIICGGTCKRTGAQQNPIWDKYRSDCSGLVSWAWGLKPPGNICATFGEVSTPITVDELSPGDACNSGKHIFLFVGWEGKGSARIIQARGCKHPSSEDVIKIKKIDEKTLLTSDGLKFHPIRAKSISPSIAHDSKIELITRGCDLYLQLANKY